MRCLEWLFAIVAFACCCNFSSYCSYTVQCSDSSALLPITHSYSYPFRLDHTSPVNVTCKNESISMYPPGDFASDAQFFVFTGVLSFLGTMASLLVYVFFSPLYLDDQKKGPMIDFCFTVIVAVFWLSASAAWANGVIGLKYASNPTNWIYGMKNSICEKKDGHYVHVAVKECLTTFTGSFTGANVSIIVGFLNFFLWTSNLWFLYKETSWFATRSQQGEQMAA